MHRLFCILSLGLSSLTGIAQTPDEQEVILVIDTFFTGMKDGDPLRLGGTLMSDCSLKSVFVNPKSGKTEVQIETMDNFVKVISDKDPNVIYDERISSYDIKIDGPMAVAWTPYQFYLNGTFSHCGVNVFSLIKHNDEWKIISIMDTRRKEDCK